MLNRMGTPSTRMLIAAAAIAAALYAIVSLPASLVPALAGFDRADVRYETARGSFWNGVLAGVQSSGVELGEVRFQIAPLSLLAGEMKGDFTIHGGALEGEGVGWARPNGAFGLRNSAFTFRLDAASRYAFLGEPLRGNVRADIRRLELSHGECVVSETRLVTDVLTGPAQRFDSEAFDLAGEGACDSGDLLVTLTGRGEDGAVKLTIRITPEMNYVLAATAEPSRKDVAEALEFFGFEDDGETLKIDANGVIRAVGS